MSINEAYILVNKYVNFIPYFVDEYKVVHAQRNMISDIRLSDVIAHAHLMGSKEGNAIFNRWKMTLKNNFNECKLEKNMTVFERINRDQRKTNTVFDKLKRLNHGI